jgi:hypothetical protein
VLDVALREVDHAIHHERKLERQVAAFARVGDDAGQIVGRGADVEVVDRLDPQRRSNRLADLSKKLISQPKTVM